MQWWTDLHDLVLGSACAACGRPGVRLCAACLRAIDEVPHPVHRDCLDVPVVAGNGYRPVMVRLVPAFKDDGALQLRTPLGRRLAAAVRSLDGGPGLVLVPVPSLEESRRRRGLDHGLALARTAARATGSRALPLVGRVRPGGGHQRGRSRQERRALLTDEMRVTRRPLRGAGVIVTDDVVTTGSSLAATVAALRSAGVPVVGAAVIGDADRRLEPGVDVAAGRPGGE